MNTLETAPNVKKSLMALRHLGYANEAAIGDLIDNSIDAEARKIKVFIREDSIVIGDTGHGMSQEILQEALRLGSDIEHNPSKDLGYYGMGLITAAISMGRCITIVTKTSGNQTPIAAVEDLDTMSEANKFVITIGEADEEMQTLYSNILGSAKSGTVVRITKLDTIKHPETFVQRTNEYIARTFRKYLPFIPISLNNKQVHLFDPMYAEAGGSAEFDQVIKILDKDVRVVLYRIPDNVPDANQTNQGFSLMRNAREIGHGHWYGIWNEKHPDLNHIRGEIFFPADLDDVFGVDFTKQQPKLGSAVIDVLREKLYPEISRLKNVRASAKRQERAATTVKEHSKVEKVIASAVMSAAPALVGAKGGETRRGPGRPPKKAEAIAAVTEGATPAKFEVRSMTVAGPVYDTETVNSVVHVYWNSDHPFYQRFLVNNPATMEAVDMLVYSLAKSENETRTEINKTVFVNLRSTISNVLRGLLTK